MKSKRSTSLEKNSKLIVIGPQLQRPIPTLLLSNGTFKNVKQIAIDGGIHFAPQASVWVGDGDSSTPPKDLPQLFKPSQNETDFGFFLRLIRRLSFQEIHCFGFLGGRLDHELANFGESFLTLKKNSKLKRMIFYDSDFQTRAFLFSKGKHNLKIKATFSVLCFETTTVSISGKCLFAVKKLRLAAFSGNGVSNTGKGAVTFEFSKPTLVILNS